MTDTTRSIFAGWTIEIFGEKDIIDMTSSKFQWKKSAPYKSGQNGTDGAGEMDEKGFYTWILTPEMEVKLKKEKGESARARAWCVINQLKGKLEKLGFASIQTGPMTFGPKRNQTILYIWTLTKAACS